MSNVWLGKVARESRGLKGYKIVPLEEKYQEVYDLMKLPEYDTFFYEGDMETFEAKKAQFNKGLLPQYQSTGVVALYGDKPVAFCLGATRSRSLVMATDPAHVGHGLGTLLLELVLRKYRLCSFPTALALTKSTNVKMQSILERYGERIDTDEPDHYLYQLDTDTDKNLTQYRDVLKAMNTPVRGV